MATHCNVVAWEIPERGAWLATLQGSESDTTEHTCTALKQGRERKCESLGRILEKNQKSK